jgi:hypothetical protein
MRKCDAIRERLAVEGVGAAETVIEIKHHLAGCVDCTKILDELRRVEGALAALPEHDAPDALVAETLRAVRQAAQAEKAPSRPFTVQQYVGLGLAASVVIAAGLGLTLSREWLDSTPMVVAANQPEPGARFYDSDAGDRNGKVDQLAQGPLAKEAPSFALREEQPSITERETAAGSESFETAEPTQKKSELDAARALQNLEESEMRPAQQGAYRDSGDLLADEEASRDETAAALKSQTLELLGNLQEGGAQQPVPSSSVTAEGESLSAVGGAKTKPDERQGLAGAGQIAGDLRADQPTASAAAGNEAPATEPARADDKTKENKRRALTAPAESQLAPTLADAFLERYRTLDGLSFQDPTGYWSNSYIPGDPAMRLLEARLRDWDRSVFGRDVKLEEAVRPVQQPFDAPEDAAVALFLHADTAAIDGPTRLRIQVGVKGAERQGGHRPAMNLGLLVDLRGGVDGESARRIRALIDALERARQPEDRFSLTVAGPDGGLLVAPDQFRHGPLQVAMERMFGDGPVAASAAGPSLSDAFAAASRSVRAGDDPNAVLGSSLVLLVTGASLADDLATLERMAHLNAVAGVPTSVVGLAAHENLTNIDRLVAAGQGNRRILDQPKAAEGLIDRELNAASRAVARALRLRIRLAPGVKLVDVLGSQRLDEALAQRVREAEVAIDQRLARNLGIEPDRGEDEEGIQIVIPNFYAGDSHTILLDVVAEKPGPLADVTLRYKDVVNLRNGVARANLTLEDSGREAGPLERNVLKNLVTWEFAQRTRRIARYLADGEPRPAVAALASLRDLIRGLRQQVPGWEADQDLLADEAVLEEYLAVLATPAAGDAVQRRYLADSLRYAAFRKLQTAAR